MSYNWINARERFAPPTSVRTPVQYDKEVSQIIGRNIPVNDRRLIKLIAKWKKEAGEISETESYNFLKNPKNIEELKQVLA